MRLNRFGYLIKEGVKSIFTHGFMSFASITIIIACLIIMGSFSLVVLNIDELINSAESDYAVVAFIDASYDTKMARAVESQIAAIDNVIEEELQFITKEEALESWKDQLGKDDMFDDLEPETLRDRYVIYLKDISLIEQTHDDLNKIPAIASVKADFLISQGFVRARNIFTAISIVIVGILAVISVFIMSNTIKLTTFGRREEIAIMKMVGATNGFIRFPFIIEGMALGLIGAGIAFLAQWGIYLLVSEKVMASIAEGFLGVIAFEAVMLPVLAAFAIIGFVVGTFGGTIAIRNYLKV